MSLPTSAGKAMTKVYVKPHSKVYKHIIKNQPYIDLGYAERLSKAIYSFSNKYKVNPLKVSAILAQECMYRLKCINDGSKDYGIGQINIRTIRVFKLDKKKLLTDLEYSVESSVIVLADFKRMYGHKEQDYWTRYNSSRPSKRQVYKQLVARYM